MLGIAARTVRAQVYPGLKEVHLVAFTASEMAALLAAAAEAAGEGAGDAQDAAPVAQDAAPAEAEPAET